MLNIDAFHNGQQQPLFHGSNLAPAEIGKEDDALGLNLISDLGTIDTMVLKVSGLLVSWHSKGQIELTKEKTPKEANQLNLLKNNTQTLHVKRSSF